MVGEKKRPLKVFLCHASGDKPPVRDLYKRLTTEGVDAWLDQEKLLPGQDWRMEIPHAVRESDVVVICLSKKSITKEGYIQKEIKFALDIAEEKPEGTIFLIPARLEDCVVPDRLNRWQWVDLYEEDGFVRLLRSLKLRADAVDATVEPTSYIDSEKETNHRLEQLYTEGLAAFYTEDWDKACQRFQTILSERPNHKQASEKLDEAERQRNLAKLYDQATDAVQNMDWGNAIQILEELTHKSTDYKDAAQLLRNARKQKQLRDLYAEAKALHAGKQWEAVVKVFEQTSSIDPNYPDADGLLPSAQKEVAELKRIAELNEQYSHALHEMDAGNWYEARRLLEMVHKSETGFLETEKLLKKIENEIVKEEERRKQNDQINTLYEQAHGLLRSKKWRNALDKMGEIRKLDEHYPDTDGIAEKAQKELEREEQEAEQQNKLAALSAEAVKLLKEEKYQEALDKWRNVKAIDPKYLDRQWVGRTAKKALAKQVKPTPAKPRFVISKSLWAGLGGIAVTAIVIFAIIKFGNDGNSLPPAPTEVLTINETDSIVPIPTTLLTEERIVYSGTDGSGDQIFLMDPDGGNVEQLTFDPGQVRRHPSISPNGDKIAFSSGQWGDMNLYLINPDGSGLTSLTELKGDEYFPKWSPDGKTIVFSSTRDGNSEIYSINVDQTGFTRLTNDSAEDISPYWNPDGTTIVFSSGRGGDFDIYTMKPDGSDLRRLTTNNSNDSRPSWSLNGDYIAFTSERDGNIEIYIMKSDGSDQTNITNHPSNDYYPNWSPDGTHIVFFSDRDGDESIEIYSLELSSNVTARLAAGGSPFWGVVVSDDGKRPSETLTPTTDGNMDPTMYDDFENTAYDGSYNKSLWEIPEVFTNFDLVQDNGNISIQVINSGGGVGLNSMPMTFPKTPIFVEARVFLDPATINKESLLGVGFVIWSSSSSSYCAVNGLEGNKQAFNCIVYFDQNLVEPIIEINEIAPSWHIIRMEYDPENRTYSFQLDGLLIGSIALPAESGFLQTTELSGYTHFGINNNGSSQAPVGYVDYIRMGVIEDDSNSK